jgi:hypothetical protein
MTELCQFENCRKRAFYGYTNGSLQRCKTHKEDRLLASQICRCGKKRPHYNLPGEASGICCARCRTEEMVTIYINMCPCGKRPIYNLPGECTGLCCPKCKTVEMVNVVSKMCPCGKHPGYNLPGKRTGLCCAGCKTEEMVNVVSKKCPCGKVPYFNIPGKRTGTHCVGCKTVEMIDVVSKKCSCGKQPYYNLPGEASGLCCVGCKTEEMVNVRDKMCQGQEGLCTTVGNKKYRGYCTFCFKHLFPNDPLTLEIRTRTKELIVREFINTHFEGFIHDKQLQTNHCDCTMRRRPDHVKLIGNTMLIVETDENGHKTYSEMDEETRYNDLYMVHFGKWVYIRFNPDRYRDVKGKWVDPDMSVRLEALKLELEIQIGRIENEENMDLVERVYMYYDQV